MSLASRVWPLSGVIGSEKKGRTLARPGSIRFARVLHHISRKSGDLILPPCSEAKSVAGVAT